MFCLGKLRVDPMPMLHVLCISLRSRRVFYLGTEGTAESISPLLHIILLKKLSWNYCYFFPGCGWNQLLCEGSRWQWRVRPHPDLPDPSARRQREDPSRGPRRKEPTTPSRILWPKRWRIKHLLALNTTAGLFNDAFSPHTVKTYRQYPNWQLRKWLPEL